MPETRQVWVVHPAHQTALPMRRVHPAGLYEAICPWQSDEQQRRYQLRVSDNHGEMKTIEDPYAFPSLFSGYELYLLGEGKHYRAYERLGAHLRTDRRRIGRELRRLGAERGQRECRRRL